MRIAFFGSAPIAVHGLCALLDVGHEIAVVVTQPDRPAGRGGHARGTPVKERACMLGIPVEQPDTLRDGIATQRLREYHVDLAVVVAYGKLIPPAMLAVPPHGFVNIHASLLPKYRGAAPVPHAILQGETETGVTIFRLNERWDAGDVLGRESIPLHPDDTAATVLERLAPIGARLLCGVVGQMEAGWVQPIPQIESEVTYAPKLTKEMGHLDFYATPARIDRRIRAFQPWPLAYAFLGEGKKRKRLNLLSTTEVLPPPHKAGREATPGTVLLADPRAGLVVACGEGMAMRLSRIQPEGKRVMEDVEYLRGAHLKAGDCLR